MAAPLRAAGVSWPGVAQFALASVFIDADHYAAYVYRTGDFSLRHAYLYHHRRVQRSNARFGINLHVPRIWPGANRPAHALVVIGAVALAAALVPAFRPLAGGILFHRLQDYVWESARIRPDRDE